MSMRKAICLIALLLFPTAGTESGRYIIASAGTEPGRYTFLPQSVFAAKALSLQLGLLCGIHSARELKNICFDIPEARVVGI